MDPDEDIPEDPFIEPILIESPTTGEGDGS